MKNTAAAFWNFAACSHRRAIWSLGLCTALLLACRVNVNETQDEADDDDDASTETESLTGDVSEDVSDSAQDTDLESGDSQQSSEESSGEQTEDESQSQEDSTGDSGDDDDDDGTLLSKLDVASIDSMQPVMAGARNWRVWGSQSLGVAPVFVAPLADGSTLVCYSSGERSAPHSWVLRLDESDALAETFDLGAGFECRGLAAEPDGAFGALLWQPDADETKSKIFMKRYDSSGAESWSTELTNADNKPTDFGIGDSRVDFGDGKYGAYYHVHSDTGHEGDTLKWIDASGKEETEWSWGCSHSMSAALRYHPGENTFLSACVTDCYPGTSGSDFEKDSIGGLYLGRSTKVLDIDAGCNGSMAGELGTMALANEGWKVVYNAHQAPATLGQSSYDPETMNQDIGFTAIGSDKKPGPVVWLTDTPSVNESDPTIARWAPAGGDPSFLVGWTDPDAGTYFLMTIDEEGSTIDEPIEMGAKARWGRRDDPMRVTANGDIVWAWFESAGESTLYFARLRSGNSIKLAPRSFAPKKTDERNAGQ
jgi:hypothetical protein